MFRYYVQVAEQRKQTSQDLNSLPEAVPAEQQKGWVNRELRTLAEQLQKKAEATHKDKRFYSTVRGLFEAFAKKVGASYHCSKLCCTNQGRSGIRPQLARLLLGRLCAFIGTFVLHCMRFLTKFHGRFC